MILGGYRIWLLPLLSLMVGCGGGPDPGPFEPPAASAHSQNYSGFHATIGHPFTFGIIFVENYGPDAAVLDSVQLVNATTGVEVTGVLAADITDEHHNWLTSDNFPPKRPEGTRPLAGFPVAPAAAQSVQILVGIELTDDQVAGFDQIAVDYHVGDHAYRYVMPSGAVLCPPSYYESTGRKTCERAALHSGTQPLEGDSNVR